MGLDLQYLDLHSLKINMIFKIINKKEILREVKKSISLAKEEVLATMLLKDELRDPLPAFYFHLLRKKVYGGIFLKRLGFGTKEEYNKIKERNKLENNNYEFRYIIQESEYQRLIIIDRKMIFFGIEGLYFTSKHKSLIKIFLDYFDRNFKKGKI